MPLRQAVLSLGLLLALAPSAWGAGGTSQIATKGQKVTERESWPKGLEALLNLPTRTDGWNGWFSEWPNDVEHYQFQVKTTDEANAVLAAFGNVKSDKLLVRLSTGKEPGSIGWVSRIKDGNDTAIIYTHGDQARLDEWYARLKDGKFGVMEFLAAPIAVPPTLVIYVENKAIDLDKLAIPAKITVESGGLPGLFLNANLKVDPTKPLAIPKVEVVDKETQRVRERIDKVIAARKKVS
jgi:hypothetical protein